jgi:hypothetical protein
MPSLNNLKSKKALVIIAAVLVGSILVTFFAYHIASTSTAVAVTPTAKATEDPALSPTTPTRALQMPRPTPTISPTLNPGSILGVSGSPGTFYQGIFWVRLGYPTCGWGNLTGNALKQTIQNYHDRGFHVLLITCQPAASGPRLFNTQQLNDLAHGGADAVQCGNEEMKLNALTTYIEPADFARYFDLCQHAVHAVQPNIPVLLGALDPQVGGVDFQGLNNQVYYLDQVQTAMNTQVHPGGNWTWRSQVLGLIDSWHNGYPSQYVNSLYGLFVFWAQQFGVDLNSGALGKHIWVVEGTGCFKGCGIDPYNSYQVAVSHILTLTADVQTTMQYHIPFFYFNDKDFIQSGETWPIGILDVNGHSKPIRQDLPMGARTLTLACHSGQVSVADQEKLLAKLYQGCSLPGDYIATLTS